MRVWLSMLTAAFVLTGASAEASSERVDNGIDVYSSLCLHDESGDVLGMRITLARYPEETYVWFQDSEGWPEIGQIVPADLDKKSGKIHFKLALQDKTSVGFVGQISATQLAGSFDRAVFDPDHSGHIV
jgi:hypothetical protein